mmetsp:Transcript_98433/g.177740  ORF Transcript_98433/g.177740 Transcript_98433/m.177740 type:complete len:211 (+) Transcript_98433:1301-1933(+)
MRRPRTGRRLPPPQAQRGAPGAGQTTLQITPQAPLQMVERCRARELRWLPGRRQLLGAQQQPRLRAESAKAATKRRRSRRYLHRAKSSLQSLGRRMWKTRNLRPKRIKRLRSSGLLHHLQLQQVAMFRKLRDLQLPPRRRHRLPVHAQPFLSCPFHLHHRRRNLPRQQRRQRKLPRQQWRPRHCHPRCNLQLRTRRCRPRGHRCRCCRCF